MRVAFRHAAHERRSSLNVVCGLGDGAECWGWGECLPRTYVTGEDANQVYEAIASAARDWKWPEFDSPETLCDALERTADTLFPAMPSARCAVEIALLDLGCRGLGIPALDLVRRLAERLGIPLGPADRPVTHSGVVGEGGGWSTTKRALKMRLFGLREIKVKVGSDLVQDLRRLRLLRRLMGRGTDLRVDANGAWSLEDAVEAISAMIPMGISSVEQPLAKGDESNLATLRARVDIPIGLDESLTSLADARRAIEGAECDLFNIRLSKCGGIVSSLRILAEARDARLGAWLGCMVGESPLLSAAGRAFAMAVDGLCHVEGAYDRHLFDVALAEPMVGFKRGGLGGALDGPGLGVQVNAQVLNRWTKQWDVFDLR